uniref:Uncharacterized protein n=1 Tax=Glossina austeni TaxID=7395 RepID=A0A1A9VTW0_GLOAU
MYIDHRLDDQVPPFTQCPCMCDAYVTHSVLHQTGLASLPAQQFGHQFAGTPRAISQTATTHKMKLCTTENVSLSTGRSKKHALPYCFDIILINYPIIPICIIVYTLLEAALKYGC